MKKITKILSIFSLTIFSFYYTNKIALFTQDSSDLKKEIYTYSENYMDKGIDAKVDGNTIVPGINGKKVDVNRSFKEMSKINTFNENSIIYLDIKPNISVDDFPNKVIKYGNNLKNAISIIIEKKNIYKELFDSSNIKYTYLEENKYCIRINSSDCTNSNKRIVEPSFMLDSNNYLDNISNLKAGSIIYISNNIDSIYIMDFINKISFFNINTLTLEDHLSEKSLF